MKASGKIGETFLQAKTSGCTSIKYVFYFCVTPTSGGIFGLYDGTIDEEVLRNPHCNKIKHLNDALPNNSW